jgi:penicillin-binding protein 1B
MLVWRDIIARIATRPFQTQLPEAIEYVTIDRATGKRGGDACADVIKLGFIRGSAPDETAPCAGGGVRDTLRRAFDWFGGT